MKLKPKINDFYFLSKYKEDYVSIISFMIFAKTTTTKTNKTTAPRFPTFQAKFQNVLVLNVW